MLEAVVVAVVLYGLLGGSQPALAVVQALVLEIAQQLSQ